MGLAAVGQGDAQLGLRVRHKRCCTAAGRRHSPASAARRFNDCLGLEGDGGVVEDAPQQVEGRHGAGGGREADAVADLVLRQSHMRISGLFGSFEVESLLVMNLSASACACNA